MTVETQAESNGADYLDVLLLCAAPLDVRPALNLAVEVANFEAEVRRSPVPIRLRRVFPPTLDQLRRELAPLALRGRAPRVFHFLGHGEEDFLWFENEEGSGEKVTAAQLRKVFKDSPIRLALLNACWSATSRVRNLCTHLVEDAGLVAAIGHGKPVADTSAIAFAHRFYAEITRGEPVGWAYFTARNTLAEKGLPGAAEIDLTGDGGLRLDEGLTPGERTGRVEDGMPTRGYLPGADFFCGREEEFQAVARSLADPATRGYGLWGMGGIGKTALAKEAARRNAWRFRDGGVVFVDAREITPPTTPELLRRTLARLDGAARGDDPVFELVQRLTAAPGLIVLDNLETLPETEFDALARFVAQVPTNGSHVLLTARAPIRPIDDLSGVPTRLLTTGLHDYDAAFYAHRFAEAKGVALLRDDPPRIEAGDVSGLCARLSRRVSGHPRMIEVAVGIARRGQAELDRALDRLSGDLEARLAEMLATGLALVGDEGRRLLAFLPLFPAGNFQLEAIQAACAAADRRPAAERPPAQPTLWSPLWSTLGDLFRRPALPEPNSGSGEDQDECGSQEAAPWVVEGIRQLERGGFLDRDQEADLLTFHKTMLDYARGAARLTPEQHAAAFSALLNFYVRYLRVNSEYYRAIDRCLDNVLNVMETAWIGHREPGALNTILVEMVDALGQYFERRGLWQLGIRWSERTIVLLRELGSSNDEGAIHRVLYRKACLLRNRGQYGEAVKLFREAFRLDEDTSDLRGQAASIHEQAIIERLRGNPAGARQLLQHSLSIKEQIKDLHGQAATLHELAIIENSQGNLDEARRLLRQSFSIFEQLGDLRGQAASLQQLAIMENARGHLDEARRLLHHSLAILKRVGHPQGRAAVLHVLAIVERVQGNLTEARRLHQQSFNIKEDIGDLQGQAATLHELAIIERIQGNPTGARWLFQQSLGLKERLGDVRGQAATLNELAIVERVQGNLTEARQLLRQSFDLLKQLGDLQGQSTSLYQLGSIERIRGNPTKARELLHQSLGIMKQLGDLFGQASVQHELAIIERAQGSLSEAYHLLQQSLAVFERFGNLHGKAATLHELAIIERVQGNLPEARRLLQQSFGILQQLGDRQGQAASLHAMALIERLEGNTAEAHRLLGQALGIAQQLGAFQTQAALLRELAILERLQGNLTNARRLLERSLALQDQVGDVEGRASTLIRLVQVEVMEGNPEAALDIALETVRLFESIENAKATMAREILARVEIIVASGSAEILPFLEQTDGLIDWA